MEELFAKNENLIYYVLKKRFPMYYFDDDIRQIGAIGLWKACKRYDSHVSKFSTYACLCIKNEILHHLRIQNAKCRQLDIPLRSLDEPIKDTDDISFGESIIGTENIEYVDWNGFWNSLNTTEKKIVYLRMEGCNQTEIGRILGVSQSQINRVLINKIRPKFEKYI